MLSWFKKKKSSGESAIPASGEVSGNNQVFEAPEVDDKNSAKIDQIPEIRTSETSLPDTENKRQENQKGLLLRLRERLSKTRDSLVSRVDDLFLGRKEIDAQLLDELEEILITADLGVNTSLDLLEEIRIKVSRQELKDPQALKLALKEKILTFFNGYDEPV